MFRAASAALEIARDESYRIRIDPRPDVKG